MFLGAWLWGWAGLAAGQGVTVNINVAPVEKLEKLPGVGPVKAQAIADYRAEHGRITQMRSLLEVKGIGPVTLDKIRPHIVFTAPPERYRRNPDAAPPVGEP